MRADGVGRVDDGQMASYSVAADDVLPIALPTSSSVGLDFALVGTPEKLHTGTLAEAQADTSHRAARAKMQR